MDNWIDVACIESPGLTSAPSIASYVKEIVVDHFDPSLKEPYIARRKGFVNTKTLSDKQWNDLIQKILAMEKSYAGAKTSAKDRSSMPVLDRSRQEVSMASSVESAPEWVDVKAVFVCRK